MGETCRWTSDDWLELRYKPRPPPEILENMTQIAALFFFFLLVLFL